MVLKKPPQGKKTGFFKGIEDIDPGEERVPFFTIPGKYLLELTSCTVRPSGKNKKQSWFRAEFVVLEGPPSVAEGEEHLWQCDPEATFGDTELGLKDIKRFAQALLPGEDITEEVMEELIGDAQEAVGTKVRAKVHMIKTSDGKDFPKVTFMPYEEDE